MLWRLSGTVGGMDGGMDGVMNHGVPSVSITLTLNAQAGPPSLRLF